MGDVEPACDAGERLTVSIAGEGMVDLLVGEPSLLSDGGAACPEDFQDAAFAEPVLGGEPVGARARLVSGDDRGPLRFSEAACESPCLRRVPDCLEFSLFRGLFAKSLERGS
nr:hypothetical protein [Nocardia acidivorans]